MRLGQISSQSITSALWASTQALQRKLTDAEKEVVTGQYADAALTLGARNGKRISILREAERLDAILETNALASSRLSVTQGTIGSINEVTQSLQSSLTSVLSSSAQSPTAAAAARTAVEQLTGMFNTNYNGDYVFAGINTDVPPLEEFDGGQLQALVNSAFQTWFGFPKTDPQAGFLSKSQIAGFLSGSIEPLFLGASWNSTVSKASDTAIISRITISEQTVTSVTANEAAFRKAMYSAVISAEFLESGLGAEALSGVTEKAIALSGEASGELARLQGKIGFTQARLSEADQRLSNQNDHLSGLSNDLAAVDPYEASTRLNGLLSQIEASYLLTARIQKLSFMNFMG